LSFTGEFRHTLDAKGRLIVPVRMRDELAGGVVHLTRWLDGCIAMWSSEGWARMEGKLAEQPVASSPTARAFVRLVSGSHHEDEIDKQGRITVPQHLREFAEVTRDCVVTGAVDHGEVWSPEKWEQQQALGEDGGFEQLAAEGLNF
jgi:MraZ protein